MSDIQNLTAEELWEFFSNSEYGCQDCFKVEITFDPAFGPALYASSCTINPYKDDAPIGPFATVADLMSALAEPMVDE